MTKQEDKLRLKLSQIPELPGIYKMLDSKGNVIYIGKSKCLKKRVKSYFTAHPKWDKVEKLVSFIDDIEFIVTDTHLEARLLECELIKEVKPAFNSQMKRDTGYVYLEVQDDYKRNPLAVVNDRTVSSYGPFRSRFKLCELISAMKNVYPLIRNGSHYEFEYCLLPMKLDKNIYRDNREILLELLSDGEKTAAFISSAENKMEKAASLYQYETAVRYRDLVDGWTMIMHGINGYKDLSTKNILLNIPVREGNKLFLVSQGFIRYKQFFPFLSEQVIQQFITESLNQPCTSDHNMNEKSGIDFRDIIYSEILSLPEDMVTFLPDE